MVRKIEGDAGLFRILKISVCILICLLVGGYIMSHDLPLCRSSMDYSTIKDLPASAMPVAISGKTVEQNFVAKGTMLNKIGIYMTGGSDHDDTFKLQLADADGNVLFDNIYPCSEYPDAGWKVIDVSIHHLRRNAVYSLQFYTESADAALYSSDHATDEWQIYDSCTVEGVRQPYYLSIGFQMTYIYVTPAGIVMFVLTALHTVLLLALFCIGIFRFGRIYRIYRETKRPRGYIYALYFSLNLIFLFDPLEDTAVTGFGREIGAGYIAGYDVTHTIRNFTCWFLLFALFYVIYFLLVNAFLGRQYRTLQKVVLRFLDNVFVLAIVNMMFRSVAYFYEASAKEGIFYYSSCLLEYIIFFSILYIILGMDRYVSPEKYYQGGLCAFSMGITTAVLFKTEWGDGQLVLGMQILLMLLFCLLCRYAGRGRKGNGKSELPAWLAFGTAVFPFFTSFYIELLNILNQRRIFIGHPWKYYVIACILLFTACAFFVFWAIRGNRHIVRWEHWCNIWIISGIVCLYQQIALENVYDPDIFETANCSVLISGFLKFGKIPLVEQAGHHMLDGVLEGVLYALLNGDAHGAIVSPYAGYVMLPVMLLFYAFMCKAWNRSMALWTTILLPVYAMWSWFGWGILVAVCVILFVRNNTYLHAELLWLACVWCVLYRADVGISFGAACVITLTVYIITYKNWKAIKILLLPLGATGVCGGALWCILCLARGIDPVTRCVEFIKLYAAQINWAYETMGNNALTVYACAYLIVPFAVIASLLYVIFSTNLRQRIEPARWLLLLILGFAYLANFSRGLIRHSLVEMSTTFVFWTAWAYLALLGSCLMGKKKMFVPIFSLLLLCNNMLMEPMTPKIFNEKPIMDKAAENIGNFVGKWYPDRFAGEKAGDNRTYWEWLRDNEVVANRVQYSDGFLQRSKPYEEIFDLVLDENETFLDFIYVSYFYAEFDRPDPVYIAQSPTMLSGELSQEYFIDELTAELDNVPIALMPAGAGDRSDMDAIRLNYKYYKIAEFIYANYRPLCLSENFAVWCLNDRYEELRQRLFGAETEKSETYEPVDWGYDDPQHNYVLKFLPLFWAEMDQKNAADNPQKGIAWKEGDIWLFDKKQVTDSTNGNYLLLQTDHPGEDLDGFYEKDDEEADASVILGRYENGLFTDKFQYDFTVREGEHKYLFRVSSDYYWRLDDVNAVKIIGPDDLRNTELEIIQGD